jgi:glycosyltransferase involved in cell wall biosynthesis
MNTGRRPVRVLLEMRPAFEDRSGLAQVSRMLFRGLSSLGTLHVEGLLQSVDCYLAGGLPADERSAAHLCSGESINRIGNVVISLEQRPGSRALSTALNTARMAIAQLLGASHRLTRLDGGAFPDYLWRRMFAQTLPPADLELVTRATYRIARIPWNAMHICAYATRKLGFSLFARLDTSGFDLMICETPYPGFVSGGTRLIVHYHDAIPVFMPHTISRRRYHQAFHFHALRRNVASGAWFVCVSEATRQQLLAIYPQVESRSLTIHNIVSPLYFDDAFMPERVTQIIAARPNSQLEARIDRRSRQALFSDGAQSGPLEYLLVVAKIEPRKNHLGLLSAWEKLRSEGYPDLRLVIVGPVGLQQDAILRRFNHWLARGALFLLDDLSAAELRILYKHARATVCPSFSEGFDFSGVEAMKSGGAVVASDIPAHREIYADAAEYFNPYSPDDQRRAIADVIAPGCAARRAELVSRGAVVCRRYDESVILPQWEAFLLARADSA